MVDVSAQVKYPIGHYWCMIALLFNLACLGSSATFVNNDLGSSRGPFCVAAARRGTRRRDQRCSTLSPSTPIEASLQPGDDNADASAVRAPLRYVGPYPCLSLRFPDLSTSSQRSRNVTGVSLDFVLDTAANANTINGEVASELKLQVVGSALPGVGAGGAISGADTYLLGDCQLEGVVDDEERPFLFMCGLTASSLPIASPAAAGLLGVFFFNAFRGGVEFAWGGDSDRGIPPSVTFFSDTSIMDTVLKDMHRIPIKQLSGSFLPSVSLQVNGVTLPALLDTGSPITVLNGQAARLASVSADDTEIKSSNPLARVTKGFKEAHAAARGDILLVAGTSGETVKLVKSSVPVGVQLGGASFGNDCSVYVGDLPGLAALGGLGGDSAAPAVVLGMDVLRRRPRMIYREQEVFF